MNDLPWVALAEVGRTCRVRPSTEYHPTTKLGLQKSMLPLYVSVRPRGALFFVSGFSIGAPALPSVLGGL
ncbi:MAG: hypothetical protein ABL921_07350 [Pirellula sp.]